MLFFGTLIAIGYVSVIFTIIKIVLGIDEF